MRKVKQNKKPSGAPKRVSRVTGKVVCLTSLSSSKVIHLTGELSSGAWIGVLDHFFPSFIGLFKVFFLNWPKHLQSARHKAFCTCRAYILLKETNSNTKYTYIYVAVMKNILHKVTYENWGRGQRCSCQETDFNAKTCGKVSDGGNLNSPSQEGENAGAK